MGPPSSKLTKLQTEVLGAFFSREQRLYLTGGGALAGYHLGHRETHDLEETFANKLCTLLGRSEIRDLGDARALEGRGLPLNETLAAAQRKDGGLTPAQLAWVLCQVSICDDAALPGGVAPGELRDYLGGLVERLVRLAHP
jgi:hypothetical protein